MVMVELCEFPISPSFRSPAAILLPLSVSTLCEFLSLTGGRQPTHGDPATRPVRPSAASRCRDLAQHSTRYWRGRSFFICHGDIQNEAVGFVSGASVYGELKFESGTHRVQRVPVTEKSGCIHSSVVTIAILPQAG